MANRVAITGMNELELAAVVIAIDTFGDHLQGQKVVVYCDNTATVCAINNGTSRSKVLMVALRRLASLCLQKGIALRAKHLLLTFLAHLNR